MASNDINLPNGKHFSLKDTRFTHLYADIPLEGGTKTVELTDFQNGEAFSWTKTENDTTISSDYNGAPIGVINHSKTGTLTINASEGGFANKVLFQLYKLQGNYESGSGTSAFNMRMVNDNWGETANFNGCLIQKIPDGHMSNSITARTWVIDVFQLENGINEDAVN
ncbi:phage protein [Lactobacillus bombicola]|uniref:phage protein n=1 Tax=Lactobacillus bombicola TaxID=1505723 RepID=UPI000E59369B|nr:phage protein [Lactobacillus bombicola]RHW48692.1 hypothetical protein DS833_07545 [Lactobacillus bombicola]